MVAHGEVTPRKRKKLTFQRHPTLFFICIRLFSLCISSFHVTSALSSFSHTDFHFSIFLFITLKATRLFVSHLMTLSAGHLFPSHVSSSNHLFFFFTTSWYLFVPPLLTALYSPLFSLLSVSLALIYCQHFDTALSALLPFSLCASSSLSHHFSHSLFTAYLLTIVFLSPALCRSSQLGLCDYGKNHNHDYFGQ